MKGFTKETFQKDYDIISKMFDRYSQAIYEAQEGQPGHYDNQPKLVRLTMSDIRCGLHLALNALNFIKEADVLEDKKKQ